MLTTLLVLLVYYSSFSSDLSPAPNLSTRGDDEEYDARMVMCCGAHCGAVAYQSISVMNLNLEVKEFGVQLLLLRILLTMNNRNQ